MQICLLNTRDLDMQSKAVLVNTALIKSSLLYFYTLAKCCSPEGSNKYSNLTLLDVCFQMAIMKHAPRESLILRTTNCKSCSKFRQSPLKNHEFMRIKNFEGNERTSCICFEVLKISEANWLKYFSIEMLIMKLQTKVRRFHEGAT